MQNSKIINSKTKDLIHLIQKAKSRYVDLSIFSIYNKKLLYIQEGVFPFDLISHSSKVMSKIIPENPGNVLHLRTGTGIQPIIASYKGAKSVLAVDIDEKAINNAKINMKKLNLDNVIVKQSDLFENAPKTKFDTIIAQLPFADSDYNCEYSHMLFDLDYNLHERLFEEINNYLKMNGKLLLTNGDVGNNNKLYYLLKKYGFKILETYNEIHNNLSWDAYTIGKEET